MAIVSLAMIPAATAVAAGSACGETHVITTTVTFPAGYWTEGSHAITFEGTQRATGGVVFTNTYPFSVDDAAPLYPGAVLITNYGNHLGLLASDGVEHGAINPAQLTVARDIFASDDVPFLVFLHNNFSETVRWDTAGGSSMQVGGLSSLCIYGGPYKQAVNAEWLRAYPLFYKG